jgi:hypothetical protein
MLFIVKAVYCFPCASVGDGEHCVRKLTFLFALIWLAVAPHATYAQVFGNWAADLEDTEFVSAVTANDNGHMLGQFCSLADNTCYWVLRLSTQCEENHRYPVLANSDAGAASLEVLCTGAVDSGDYAYVFTDFEQVEKLIRDSKTRVAFALPMDEDQFRVIRFDLRGAEPAISKMRETAQKHSRRPQPLHGTKGSNSPATL